MKLTPINLAFRMTVVGTAPPPIGGVTVHVKRLCDNLALAGFRVEFVDLRRLDKISVLLAVLRSNLVHLHISSPTALCLLVILARAFRTRCVITVHGNLARYTGIRRPLMRLALSSCSVPILLNPESFRTARSINSDSRLLSAYIPPVGEEVLPRDLLVAIKTHQLRFKKNGPIIISNAYRMAFTQAGREIYGIRELIDWAGARGLGVVISDPSGDYFRWASQNSAETAHVLFLANPHSFLAALCFCDIFVRNTITDGDSISIHEALSLNKSVWATNVVSRPQGTFCYDHINEIDILRSPESPTPRSQVVQQLIEVYTGLLQGQVR